MTEVDTDIADIVKRETHFQEYFKNFSSQLMKLIDQGEIVKLCNNDILIDTSLLQDHLSSKSSLFQVESLQDFETSLGILGFHLREHNEYQKLRFSNLTFNLGGSTFIGNWKKILKKDSKPTKKIHCIKNLQFLKRLSEKHKSNKVKLSRLDLAKIKLQFALRKTVKPLEVGEESPKIDEPDYVKSNEIAGYYGEVSIDQLKVGFQHLYPVYDEKSPEVSIMDEEPIFVDVVREEVVPLQSSPPITKPKKKYAKTSKTTRTAKKEVSDALLFLHKETVKIFNIQFMTLTLNLSSIDENTCIGVISFVIFFYFNCSMALQRKLPTKIFQTTAHSQKVSCLDIGETGRVLVTGGQDRLVNLFAIGNDKPIQSLDGHHSRVESVRFTNNDDYVYSADENGIIKKWDLNNCDNNSTFYGHMKSVKSLDFHPYGDYLVSGSHDTSVRLWDTKNNECIKKYRGHIANVNSVKFSPDGSWIASAGTEGSVIIWDVRMSNKILEFIENGSPVTSLQFHPYEFLMAAGRNDGSVDLYDLESKQMISRIERREAGGNSVKCITFSDNGDCLFVGTTQNISVLGWEPDREFDRIESTWSHLGDMKVLNGKLICGGFENRMVSVHAISLDKVIPFYNPANVVFNHQQSSRKSFSKGNGKLRLSLDKTKSNGSKTSELALDSGGLSSPNLSIEMIDEEMEPLSFPMPTTDDNQFEFYALSKYKNAIDYGNNLTTNGTGEEKYQLSKIINEDHQESTTIVHGFPLPDPDGFNYKPTNIDGYSSDLDYYSPNRFILSNVSAHEDFTVKSAQQPDYAPKLPTTNVKPMTAKQKMLENHDKRRSSPPGAVRPTNLRKNNSVSTVDLSKIDEQFSSISTSSRKPISRGSSPIRSSANSKIRKSESSYQVKNQNQKNLTVQFFTKPQRSKTAIDMKSNNRSSIPRSVQPPPVVAHLPPSHNIQPMSIPTSYNPTMSYEQHNYNNSGSFETSSEAHELQNVSTGHDTIFNTLCNRITSLDMIRNQMRTQDLLAALRAAARIKDDSVIVDFLGAILERNAAWTLDMCVLVLPSIFELLQSDYKFHCQRACDSLRIIIKEFLPIIQANCDPWSPARSLGVDITREERAQKCLECRSWLLKIRCLPENDKIGNSLQPLQNMIVDI
ncbi:CLUMA_CG009988, isoform A [Clunio marinus]|uniref:Katanin p80 WD40 repeat-containing subunit B1 n=1 Tax=Clunio marinus TaxID=568069 RepID=A0A1J1ICD9_9DIPT|nr:CLUMA_CG009988, isoform A [Clunio marinus]